MNERIKELAEQAAKQVDDDLRKEDEARWYSDLPMCTEKFQKKFAELIVKECVGVVNKRYMGDNNREDMEVRRCVEDLKRHFGVEE